MMRNPDCAESRRGERRRTVQARVPHGLRGYHCKAEGRAVRARGDELGEDQESGVFAGGGARRLV